MFYEVSFREYARAWIQARNCSERQCFAAFKAADFFPLNEFGEGWYNALEYYSPEVGYYYARVLEL